MRIVSMVMAGAIAIGCGGSSVSPEPPPSLQPDPTVGAGDVFDVRVYGEEELTGTYRVSQDGGIDYPFVGRIQVVGLNPEAIADLIAERLREGQILNQPQVSVFVKENNSKRISVVGAVSHPGNFELVAGMTAVHAISLAGGFTSIASRNDTVVTRRVEGRVRRYPVPVEDVTEGNANDFDLQAGDIIYVPERVF